MGLQQNLDNFRNSVAECQQFITYAHNRYTSGGYKVQASLRKFISESSFLKLFIAWEKFLEESFIDYLMNEQSILGNRPAKFANPIDREHAQKLLIGTQKYVDWSNPEITRRLSIIYFHQGYVFNSELGAIQTDLFDLKTIRNSAAHLSSTTSSQLDALSTRLLRTPCHGYTAYDLLFSLDPLNAGQTILNKYITVLDITAEKIANG
ncbi:hypothetical protein [Algoriphagus limi]|uniref:RiboL-PSP-HEPN domain-containing protein n=1 Tax=Algoriphagus limi TaxID=2975273 RepID=A0ABT2G944_9BACT|nr:hypothetical protein [Algoriphagus limi]MCS5491793.1 hypothetical protein [Algoriphagus limi]